MSELPAVNGRDALDAVPHDTREPRAGTAARVLVVDDTEGNRYVVARLLRGAGYEVLEAASGGEALDQVARRPDLVVLDINLPDMTGYDVVRRLKGDPETAAIPVLHLTASYVESADRAYGLEAGADAYLTHPVDPVVLLATVKALLRAAAADASARALASAWQATFDAISEPIFLLGRDGVVMQANRAAHELIAGAGGAEEGRADPALAGQALAALVGQRFGAEAAGAVAAAGIGAAATIRGAELRLGDRVFLATSDRVQSRGARPSGAVCVLTDITTRRRHEHERERLLAQAEGARADAEQANRAKSDFLAVMSHELRTPLNAIGGYAELLALGVRGPVNEAQREDLERIRRSQRHLISLINDVLNFAKLESGSVHFTIERFLVDEALHGAGDFIAPQLHEKGLRYEYRPCDDATPVDADREKLQQILLNLLGNAVKFTPVGGGITLTCQVREGQVTIAVADTGRGIAGDKLETIFEPFVQVDRTRSHGQEGVGLGLAISRDLARRMGGDLRATLPTDGIGARFELTLPLAADAPPDPAGR